jgi:hypothetical protein
VYAALMSVADLLGVELCCFKAPKVACIRALEVHLPPCPVPESIYLACPTWLASKVRQARHGFR